MHSLSLGARAFVPVALATVVLLGLAPAAPVAAAGPTTEAQQIIRIATTKIGDPWRYGATGPSVFDCSGLVIYAFRAAGDRAAVANGRYRSAVALYRWYQRRGLASRSNPRPGDLVVWGGGTHIGIYIGNGKAVSTLLNGVRIHGVFAVTASFTAYLHTGMSTGSASGGRVATTAATTTPHRHRTRVTRWTVNLRSGPSIQSRRIVTLARGQAVTVLAARHDVLGRTWLKVHTAGRVGWVAGWLIS